jgi:hypothetical protein
VVAGACNQRYLQLWSGAAVMFHFSADVTITPLGHRS